MNRAVIILLLLVANAIVSARNHNPPPPSSPPLFNYSLGLFTVVDGAAPNDTHVCPSQRARNEAAVVVFDDIRL